VQEEFDAEFEAVGEVNHRVGKEEQIVAPPSIHAVLL
jgi:hypothetical protein